MKIALVIGILALALTAVAHADLPPDLPALISHADLHYAKPVDRSESGTPIGNGRTGSLLWTSPTALKLQINRNDVFAEDSTTNSFPERHTDYASACGQIDINMVDYGDDIFTGNAFNQSLDVYNALATTDGRALKTRAIACVNHDVIAIEVDDQRANPTPISIDLRMLRYMIEYFPGKNADLAKNHSVLIQTRNHLATSTLVAKDKRIALTQSFDENTFHNASAVAITVAGRDAQARYANDSTARLTIAPGQGRFTIFIASAATMAKDQDVLQLANKELDAVATTPFNALLSENQSWWHDFWTKGYIRLHSPDGSAEFVEQNYTYFLYLMASSSRGAWQPRFGGLLWLTNADMREWGSQYWWANQACYYQALQPANRPELMNPMFDTYTRMAPACETAARQQWGSQGIWIPETTYFNGPEKLPDDIAAEMQELYLGKKPWDQRSQAFITFCLNKSPHNSRYNWIDKGRWINGSWIYKDRGAGPRGPVVTILSSGAKIAYLYWLQYQYTMDETFLRQRAYPMLKGVAEFYRNYPNLKKEADGRYHIHDVNNHEPVWGATDPAEEVCAMQGIIPLAIRASEILNTDAELRDKWIEFRDHLPELATSDLIKPGEKLTLLPDPPPDPTAPPGQNAPPETRPAGPLPQHWIAAVPPVLHGDPSRPSLLPLLQYDLCTLVSDQATRELGQNSYSVANFKGFSATTPISVLNTVGAAAAHLGKSEDLQYILPNQLRCLEPLHDFCDIRGSEGTTPFAGGVVLANRMTLREGPGAIDAERLGRVAEALHAALLQSVPRKPGGDPVITLFPAFPKSWEGEFRLAARGGCIVSAGLKDQKVMYIEIEKPAGGKNSGETVMSPWRGQHPSIIATRNGKPDAALLKIASESDIWQIIMTPGDVIRVTSQ